MTISRGLRREYPVSPVPAADLARLRAATLVPHARAKCPKCGSTLVADPLPHRCNPTDSPHSTEFWRYVP